MPGLTQGITTCNILAFTWRYVSLSHIAKVLITKFDSDFISTILEAQPEWDCNVPVSRVETESGGTRRRTGGEVKGQEANGVGSQAVFS